MAAGTGYNCKLAVLDIKESGKAFSRSTNFIQFVLCVSAFWAMVFCGLHMWDFKVQSLEFQVKGWLLPSVYCSLFAVTDSAFGIVSAVCFLNGPAGIF